MIKKISTKKGVITFEEKAPISGTKRLNIEIAKENLLDLKKILDFYSIKFGLIYGTLLGAIREGNFIKHDEDIDLFMLDEHKENLLSALKEILDCGFQVLRYDEKLLSIARNEEYIDFYFFRKSSFGIRKCEVGLKAKARYLEQTKDYLFLGEVFQIPMDSELFLIDLYGKNWKTPIKNTAAIDYNRYVIFRKYVKENAPFFFTIISKLKKLLSL